MGTTSLSAFVSVVEKPDADEGIQTPSARTLQPTTGRADPAEGAHPLPYPSNRPSGLNLTEFSWDWRRKKGNEYLVNKRLVPFSHFPMEG